MATVHSRAYLLIEQQLVKYNAAPLPGIELYPTYAGNMFSLSAKLYGVSDTIWQGAVLKLRLRFSENFNYMPPEAYFVTVPYHPNVDAESGRVASPLLDDPQKWNASVTLGQVLADIQHELSNPNSRLILNHEAYDIMTQDYQRYKAIVLHCVQMSQAADNAPDELSHLDENDFDRQQQQQQQQPTVTIEYDEQYVKQQKLQPSVVLTQKKINFESYHADWAAMATSNPAAVGRFRPQSQWSDPEILSAKMQDYNRIKYGNVGRTAGNYNSQAAAAAGAAAAKEQSLQRVDQMRKLYLSQRHASNLSHRTLTCNEAPIHSATGGQYPHENEVDELLNWTEDLPAAATAAAATAAAAQL